MYGADQFATNVRRLFQPIEICFANAKKNIPHPGRMQDIRIGNHIRDLRANHTGPDPVLLRSIHRGWQLVRGADSAYMP